MNEEGIETMSIAFVQRVALSVRTLLATPDRLSIRQRAVVISAAIMGDTCSGPLTRHLRAREPHRERRGQVSKARWQTVCLLHDRHDCADRCSAGKDHDRLGGPTHAKSRRSRQDLAKKADVSGAQRHAIGS